MRIIRAVNLKNMTVGIYSIIFLSLLILFTPTVYGPNPMQPQFNYNVTNESHAQNEPMIAINPLHNTYDPMDIHLAVGANDYRYGETSPGLYTSTDFSTWAYRSVPTPPGYEAQGDPCLAYDSAGNLYYSYLAFNYDASGQGEDGAIFVAKSTDEGVTWVGSPVRVGPLGDGRDLHNDKPWMVIDQTNDYIYVTWTQWHNLAGATPWADIMFARSIDGGASFQTPIQLSPTTTNQQRHWSQIALGPAGEIYVVYRRFGINSPGRALLLVKSTDLVGPSFGSETTIVQEPQFYGGDNRHTGDSPWTPTLPQIAVDSAGYIYIVWHEFVGTWDVDDDRDIQLVRSTTGGTSWDTKITVNSNANDQKDQFWPAIAVSPSGRVDVIWNDRRDDPNDELFHLYYTDSLDQGATFSIENVQVSTAQSNPATPLSPGRLFFGDYISLAETSDDVAVAVWADTRVGNQEIFIAAIKLTVAPVGPTIESCDSAGVKKDTFQLSDEVYATGTGYSPSTTYDVYLVEDVTWVDGMAIPPRVPGTTTSISSDAAGNVLTILLWVDPLVPGKYDIVVDVDDDGIYSVDIDALDDMDIAVTAGLLIIPEVALGTITVLAAMVLALIVYVAVPKWKRRQTHLNQ